jgi:hypothetical protein
MFVALVVWHLAFLISSYFADLEVRDGEKVYVSKILEIPYINTYIWKYIISYKLINPKGLHAFTYMRAQVGGEVGESRTGVRDGGEPVFGLSLLSCHPVDVSSASGRTHVGVKH